MINDSEIEAKAEELSIPAAQVEKDYVHSWVLWALQHRPKSASAKARQLQGPLLARLRHSSKVP